MSLILQLRDAAKEAADCREIDDGPCGGCLEALDQAIAAFDARRRLHLDEALVDRLASSGLHPDDLVTTNSVLFDGRKQGVRRLLRFLETELFEPAPDDADLADALEALTERE